MEMSLVFHVTDLNSLALDGSPEERPAAGADLTAVVAVLPGRLGAHVADPVAGGNGLLGVGLTNF